MKVRRFAVYGRVVELEIAGVDDRADGGVNDDAGGIRYGMVHAEKGDIKHAEVERVTRLHGFQGGAAQAAGFPEFDGDEADGEGAAVHGGTEFRQDVGQAADVVSDHPDVVLH